MANASEATPKPNSSIKETLIAITISFTMAFIFRGFVIEGFLIPTGSMAPTLLGKHMRVLDEDSGYEWTVGPWDKQGDTPLSLQGGTSAGPVVLNDPMTGRELTKTAQPILAGDRLFVLKYLHGLYDPKRWDVVVFKAPHVPQENYIKRLLGLPGEQIALVDGDVFYRPFVEGETLTKGEAAWEEGNWSIARKTERVQREMWRPVFDSTFTPPVETQEALAPSQRYTSPWSGTTPGWSGLDTSRAYRYEGGSATGLLFDTDRYPIDDYTAYNQGRAAGQFFSRAPGGNQIFPVSDIALTAGIEPDGAGLAATASINARGWTFQAVVTDASGSSDVELRRRPLENAGEPDDSGGWETIATGKGPALRPGIATRVEFWHTDQSLWLFMNGKLVAGGAEDGAYELTPAQRIEAAIGESLPSLLSENDDITRSILSDTRLYRRPTVAWSFEGSALTLHDVRVDRDVFYQVSYGRETLGTHPDYFPTLSNEHFFLCGDNSPSSLDGRLWRSETTGGIDPWVSVSIHGRDPLDVRDSMDPAHRYADAENGGLVHRDLVIGRAFVVYLPAFDTSGPLPTMLDTGRMRWVW